MKTRALEREPMIVVEVIEDATGKVVRRFSPLRPPLADKLRRTLSRRLDFNRFTVHEHTVHQR